MKRVGVVIGVENGNRVAGFHIGISPSPPTVRHTL